MLEVEIVGRGDMLEDSRLNLSCDVKLLENAAPKVLGHHDDEWNGDLACKHQRAKVVQEAYIADQERRGLLTGRHSANCARDQAIDPVCSSLREHANFDVGAATERVDFANGEAISPGRGCCLVAGTPRPNGLPRPR